MVQVLGDELKFKHLKTQQNISFEHDPMFLCQVDCLQFLIDAKMGIENKEHPMSPGSFILLDLCQDSLGWTPLAHACRNDALEAAKFLLDQRAHVNSQDVMGRTPLMLGTPRWLFEPADLVKTSPKLVSSWPTAERWSTFSGDFPSSPLSREVVVHGGVRDDPFASH